MKFDAIKVQSAPEALVQQIAGQIEKAGEGDLARDAMHRHLNIVDTELHQAFPGDGEPERPA